MKNYKAEIKKEFIKYNRWLNGAKTNIANENECIDNISFLIREIVKEGIIASDNWTHTHPIHVENIACKSCMRHDICSEILSNVEEALK